MFGFLKRKKRERDLSRVPCRRRSSSAEREEERRAALEWAGRAKLRREAGEVSPSAPPPPTPAELVTAGANERLRWRVLEVFLTHPAATEADFEEVWPLVRRRLLEKYTLSRLESSPVSIAELSLEGAEPRGGGELRLVKGEGRGTL